MEDRQTAVGDVMYDAALIGRLAEQQYVRHRLDKQREEDK